MSATLRIRQHTAPEPKLVAIRLAQLTIHMKLRVARASAAISPSEYQSQISRFNQIFDEVYFDLYLQRRNRPAYFPPYLNMTEKHLSAMAEELTVAQNGDVSFREAI